MRTSVLLSIATAAVLVGCNEPPGAPVVSISPAAPTTIDALVAVIDEEAVDPNKSDEVTYTYSWTVDGQPSDITTAEVPADMTRAGQFWSVKVSAADDKLPGGSAEASIAIENTPPTATASIEPELPMSTDDLTLVVVGEDADGDTVNTTVSWTRDGAETGISSDRVPADRTRSGETWEATVVPRDAKDAGEPVTVSVQIQNQAPEMTRIILRPTLAFEASVLEAVPSGSDPDGDPLTYTYDWIVNGTNQGPGTNNTLDGSSFDRDDTVAVQITANDGNADSTPLTSETVTILNTPPLLDGVEVTPTEAYEDTELTCAPIGWTDDDGDPADYQFSWSVDGAVAGTGDRIDGSVFDKGSRVVCTVTPFDGLEGGRTLSTRPLTIKNSLPTVSSASISPSSPPSGTTITASVGSPTDADGDEVTYNIDWYVDSRKVASGSELLPGSFRKGDAIYASVTPDDGEETGTPVKSNVVTAINSAPRITAFALTPAPIFSADAIGVAIATDDWDGDTVEVKYNWTINGTRYGSDSTTSIPSSETRNGDEVKLVVTTSDGTVAGDTRTQTEKVKLKIDPPTIVIDPDNPETTDDLFCEITKGSIDSDGGKITYHFSWTKDGSAYTGSTSTTDYTGDTIPSSATADDEEWECTVYASSPNGASVEVSKDVLVGGLQTFSFTDSTSDDLDAKDFYDFADDATYTSSYYIMFEVDSGTTRGGAWCSERADWYLDNYVKHAASGSTLRSGSWKKWSRNIGGSWSSAKTTSSSNYFGSGCSSSAYDWCSEWSVGKSLAIMPNATGSGEAYASGWGSGYKVKIQIAPTRKVACGF